MSLREPQAESLRRLADALDDVPALRNPAALAGELRQMVEALKAKFDKLLDVERGFPSLCFMLATDA